MVHGSTRRRNILNFVSSLITFDFWVAGWAGLFRWLSWAGPGCTFCSSTQFWATPGHPQSTTLSVGLLQHHIFFRTSISKFSKYLDIYRFAISFIKAKTCVHPNVRCIHPNQGSLISNQTLLISNQGLLIANQNF